MNCGTDAIRIASRAPGGGGPTIDLRRSRSCHAAWVRLRSRSEGWLFALEVKNGPRYVAYGSEFFRAYTLMTGSRKPYRACIKQYSSDTWNCTGWHTTPQ